MNADADAKRQEAINKATTNDDVTSATNTGKLAIDKAVANAAKYTRDYVHLSCRLAEDGEHFIISVEDNGMGISPDEQQKIFAAFYQAHDNKPGTGIGLNIVKNLVEAHHGMVEVKSEEGKGATFIVTLPVNQEDAVVEKDEEALSV